MRQRCILIHQTDINLITISLIQIFYHSLGIFDTAWQHQVTHDDTFFHNITFIKFCFRLLSYHFSQCRFCHFRIIFRMGIALRTLCIHIFKIGQINIHQTFQPLQCIYRFIAAAVINHRDMEALLLRLLKCFHHLWHIMSCCHQINIIGFLRLQFQKNFR